MPSLEIKPPNSPPNSPSKYRRQIRHFPGPKKCSFFTTEIRHKKRERNRIKNAHKKHHYFSLFFAPKNVGFYHGFFRLKIMCFFRLILTSNNMFILRSKMCVKLMSKSICFFGPLFSLFFEHNFEVIF